MAIPSGMESLIKKNLKPRVVEGPIEVGMSFDHLVCPICLAELTLFGDFGQAAKELKHDKRCYWAHNKEKHDRGIQTRDEGEIRPPKRHGKWPRRKS